MDKLQIRKAVSGDLPLLLELYTHLHGNPLPELDGRVRGIWRRICADPGHHIFLGFAGERLVTSCVALVVENLTNGQRPYMLIENVVTHPDFRGKGHASAILDAARDLARRQNCYKIMLLTGSKEEGTLRFYRRAGYSSEDKTGFVQWL